MSGQAQQILNALPAACARFDAENRVIWVNSAWSELFGRRDGEPGSAADWFPDETDPVGALRAAAADGEITVRLAGRRADRIPITVSLDARIEPASGELSCVGREISGEDLLSESQRYLDVAFEIAPIGMALFDTKGRYVRVNEALCRLLGRTREELIGRRDQEFTHPDHRQGEIDAAWRILNGELDTWQTEKRFITGAGEVVWAIASLAFLRDGEGRPLCWLGQFQDITERRRREEQLGHMAVHDELTTVANRRGLVAELTERLAHARRYDEPGALLIIDLDNFKEVNDGDGHQAGDELLRRTAAALRGRLRQTDFLARWGGDEFAVILPHATAEQATLVGEQLLQTLRALEPYNLGASCGVARFDGSSGDVDTLIAEADRAMYAAKSQGRGRVCLFAADGNGPTRR